MVFLNNRKMTQASDNRKANCRLRTLQKKGKLSTSDKEQLYSDWTGELYQFKWLARFSSFCKVVNGCLHNGFPIVCRKLWYNAWACWPFFFVRRDIEGDPIPLLNHERIHVRQQWDIHVTFSLPLFIFAVCAELNGWCSPLWFVCWIPFIPSILYGMEMLHSYKNLKSRGEKNITFTMVRANTCFEREAISKQLNTEYLFNRKFWGVLAYTGIKMFRNYGIS